MPEYCQAVFSMMNEISAGHQFLIEFYVNYLNAKLVWYFSHEYHTNCSTLPTSWLVRVTFHQVEFNTGCVIIPITLKRMDTNYSPVGTYLRIEITNPDSQTILVSGRSFGKKVVLPGEEMRETITEYIAYKELRSQFNEKIFVNIVLSTIYCHPKTTAATTSGENQLSKTADNSKTPASTATETSGGNQFLCSKI